MITSLEKETGITLLYRFRYGVRLTMHDDYSILSMVEQGLGYSLLAELVLQKTAYDIAVRPLEEPVLRTMALVMKDKRALSVAAKTFMWFILDA